MKGDAPALVVDGEAETTCEDAADAGNAACEKHQQLGGDADEGTADCGRNWREISHDVDPWSDSFGLVEGKLDVATDGAHCRARTDDKTGVRPWRRSRL